ncbi:hypothetical protein [Amphibacillus cookii]|uniref:hypothetical protein n=1 Tax=Amphibacillus cookii TaxID=767787 RepID=UPI00195AC191|nr:hypothetical protein [Amphibacillus cookii]MBM7543299.1 hypothetical protein [Amphibacillus cookii]
MNNIIKIHKINTVIEEEVKFFVNNQKVIGFNVSPQKLELGKEYEAELGIFVNDFLEIEEQKNTQIKKIKYDDNFSYTLWGKLLEPEILDVGFFITSELFEDYGYLVGKYVFLKIDRLELDCK